MKGKNSTELTVSFEGVSERHAGTYTCLASNDYGRAYCRTVVSVQRPGFVFSSTCFVLSLHSKMTEKVY